MATADLLTVDEALTFLKKQSVQDVPHVATFITAASQWLEQMTERPLKQRAFTTIRMTGLNEVKLYLPAWPLLATATVTLTIDGTTQTVWRAEADGDQEDFDVLVGSDDAFDERWGLRNHLYRETGWATATDWNYPGPWTGGNPYPFGPVPTAPKPYRILLSYTAGYDPVPQDLKLACGYLVQKLWRDVENQGTSVATITTPTGGSIGLREPALPAELVMLVRPYSRNGTLVGVSMPDGGLVSRSSVGNG